MRELETSGDDTVAGLWRRLWRTPDPVLADAGRQSELVVAKVRVAVTVLLLFVPLSNVVSRPVLLEHRIGFAVTLVACLLAIVVYLMVRRDRRPAWLGLMSTVFDVSLVSGALLTYILTAQPLVATNSRVAFETYFLAIAATCLRYDVRLCILAGVLSIAQYLGVVTLAQAMYDLDSLTDGIQRYGRFEWSSEVSRLILLG
ncbi:MAG: hypothetical protein MUC69_11590, partial [Gemmatimonadales bacterium]|nr:hypothetical protein [Gemmatimonadales bacterium]